MKISISRKLISKLRREARNSGDPDSFDVLLAESIARRWFLKMSIPCWRTREKPGTDGRYSLLFQDGRRAMVLPTNHSGISFDSIAKAKCDFLIITEPDECFSGRVKGFLYSFDIRRQGNLNWKPEPATLNLRRIEHFPELRNRSDRFRFSYFLGSLKLLILGDPEVPQPIKPRLP